MNWSRWIRQTHRWLSVIFTLVVLVDGVVVSKGKYNNALGLMAVVPLALMFLTGLYLFVLPYAAKWRKGKA